MAYRRGIARLFAALLVVVASALAITPASAQAPPKRAPAAPGAVADLQRKLVGLEEKGKYEEALATAARLLKAQEAALGPADPALLPVLDKLAGLVGRVRRDACGKRAWDAARASSPEMGDAERERALAACDAEYPPEVRALRERSISIAQGAFGPGDRRLAEALREYSRELRDRGRPAEAAPPLLRSIAIEEEAFKRAAPDDEQRALAGNAVTFDMREAVDLYLTLRDVPAAVRMRERESRHRERLISEEKLGLDMRANRLKTWLRPDTDELVSLDALVSPRSPDAARLALTTLLRRKGSLINLTIELLGALRERGAPHEREWIDELKGHWEALTELTARGPAGAKPEEHRAAIDEVTNRASGTLAIAAQRGIELMDSRPELTLEKIQEAIPEGAALVELYVYRPYWNYALISSPPAAGADSAATTENERSDAPRYVAYVVGRKGPPASVDLGSAAAIDEAAKRFHAALAEPVANPKPAARALDALVMQPIRRLLGDARRIFISPDGLLTRVPFAAFVDENSKYLVERFDFTYLSSGADRVRAGSNEAPREPPLFLGDPAFDDAGAGAQPAARHRGPSPADLPVARFARAEQTLEEVRDLKILVPDARVLIGPQATEGAVKAARGPRILHLATHGFFLPSARAGQPGTDPSYMRDQDVPMGEGDYFQNTLLASAVALAGVNKRSSGDQDGMLTALETVTLDLRGTKLVTLATCESGLGEASAGEGLYGLRRALMVAGAETQVISLWQVFPTETREMMVAYYKKLMAGEGRSEALHNVQLEMLASKKPGYAHPNRWASFVVSGDPRALVDRPAGPAAAPAAAKFAPQTPPGPRGCACTLAPREIDWGATVLAIALTAAAAARRRRSRRLE